VLSEAEILSLVKHQIFYNFCLDEKQNMMKLLDEKLVHEVLERSEECFSKANSKYFYNNTETVFNVQNTIQYTIFLYFLSNSAYKYGNTELASFIYYLNKIMNSIELFYSIELPEHFCMEHPLGTVLGKAQYGDYFFCYQGCTVGGNKNVYPVIGKHVIMFSDSKVLGNCHIGDNVIIGANTYIKDTDIPNKSIVYGQYPNIVIKTERNDIIQEENNRIWL
jgi:serine O-acetyltransferase